MSLGVVSGIPDRFPIKVFETDVGQVSAGTPNGGWVSGTIANLGPSTAAVVVFDLGQDWHQYTRVCYTVQPASPSTGLSNIYPTSSDTQTQNGARRPMAPGANSTTLAALFTSSQTTANGPQSQTISPMGRYIHINITNADATNAVGASGKVSLAAYPA